VIAEDLCVHALRLLAIVIRDMKSGKALVWVDGGTTASGRLHD
jgi:hypothetical protein